MITYCPRCGAQRREYLPQYRLQSETCMECALEIDPVPPMLAPSDMEVSYGLDEWPAHMRADVTDELRSRSIIYRWEQMYELVVPESSEQAVDRILDGVESREPDVTGADDDGDSDGGLEATDAMADLFVAADRVRHDPYDVTAVDQFRALEATVARLLPPYGVDTRMWRMVQDQARGLIAGFDGKLDGDLIAARAGVLRNLLRDYV